MDNGVMGLSALSPLVSAADQFIREKNIPPDQVPAYLFSVGSPELAGLTAKFQRLKNATQMMPPQGGPPPAPPTVADDINSQMMQYSGVASLPNPAMDKAQFAGGGIVAFSGGGGPLDPDYEPNFLEQFMPRQEERIEATQPPRIAASRPAAKKSSRRGATDTVAEATPPVKDPNAPKSLEEYISEVEAAQNKRGLGAADTEQMASVEKQRGEAKQQAKSDRWLGLAQAGFKMAQAASRPGATFLGSLGEGGADLTGTIREINKELRDTERATQTQLYQIRRGQEEISRGNINEGRRMLTDATKRYDDLRQHAAEMALKREDIAAQNYRARMAASSGASGRDSSGYRRYLDEELLAARKTGDMNKVNSILAEIEKHTKVSTASGVSSGTNADVRLEIARQKREDAIQSNPRLSLRREKIYRLRDSGKHAEADKEERVLNQILRDKGIETPGTTSTFGAPISGWGELTISNAE